MAKFIKVHNAERVPAYNEMLINIDKIVYVSSSAHQNHYGDILLQDCEKVSENLGYQPHHVLTIETYHQLRKMIDEVI